MVVESTATPRVQLGGRPADSSHRARAATGREAALSSCTRGSSTACNRPRRHNGKSRTLAVAAECGWRGRRRGRSGPGRKPGARQGGAAGARGRGSNEAGECRGQSGGAHAACKRRSPGAVKKGAEDGQSGRCRPEEERGAEGPGRSRLPRSPSRRDRAPAYDPCAAATRHHSWASLQQQAAQNERHVGSSTCACAGASDSASGQRLSLDARRATHPAEACPCSPSPAGGRRASRPPRAAPPALRGTGRDPA